MTASNTAAEVGVKLVLDSNAKHVTDNMKHEIGGVGGAAEKASGVWKSRLLGAGKMIGGMALSAGAAAIAAAGAVGAGIYGLAKHSAEAFEDSEEQVRGLAGTFSMIDQKGNPWEKLVDYAGSVKDELEDIGMQAGVTDDALVAVFNDIIERGGKGVDAAKDLAEQMAYAGRAIPGGAETLSAGFEALQMGMIKAKNPLVQLIATTGTLKGSAKSVAKEMQKMTIDEQMELAEKAIGKMADKMKQAPMTLAQMKTSMSVAVGNLFEGAGQPIVHALEPIMGKVRGLLMGNQSKIAEYAQTFGDNMARAVELLGPMIDGVVGGIKGAWGDIEKTFNAIYGPSKELFEYIYENKEAFGKTMGDILAMIIKVAGYLIRAFQTVKGVIGDILMAIGKSGVLGDDTARFLGDEQRAGQTKDLQKEIKSKGGLDDAEYKKRRDAYVATADGTKDASHVGEDFDKQYRRAMDDHLAVMKQVEGARDAAMADDAKKYAQMFDIATAAGDEASQQYVAKFLEGNASLQNALIKAGPDVLKNFDALSKTLGVLGDKEALENLKKGMKPNMGIAPKGNIVQNFNGAINIKQDFRDEDPDRVALVFRRDLQNQGTNRLQSRVATPFGF